MSQESKKEILAGQIWCLSNEAHASLKTHENVKDAVNAFRMHVKILSLCDDDSFEAEELNTLAVVTVKEQDLFRFVGWAQDEESDDEDDNLMNQKVDFYD